MPVEAKDKGKAITESLIPTAEKKKAKQWVKKEKQEEKENKQVKKRKTKHDNLDTSVTTKTMTKRKLTENKPHVLAQTLPLPTPKEETAN